MVAEGQKLPAVLCAVLSNKNCEQEIAPALSSVNGAGASTLE